MTARAALYAALYSVAPSDAQLYRQLVNSFRHESRKVPWDDLDYRALKMAWKLDGIRKINDAKAATAQRAAEPPVILDDDAEDHGRTVLRMQQQIAQEIYNGGAL